MDDFRGGVFQLFWQKRTQEEKENQALIRHLKREAKRKEMWDTQLKQARFVVVDTETTGFDSQKDALLSIGAVKIEEGSVSTTSFDTLIRPEPFQPIPAAITKLTGIRDEDVVQAPRLRDVMLPFLQFAQGAVLIMHHASHDMRFLNAALWKQYRVHLSQPILDTHDVARWLHPKQQRYTLDDLLRLYEIPVVERHTAIGDARMTATLWQQMLPDILQKGVHTLGDLLEQIVITKRI